VAIDRLCEGARIAAMSFLNIAGIFSLSGIAPSAVKRPAGIHAGIIAGWEEHDADQLRRL
jgi:hypothetical protein